MAHEPLCITVPLASHQYAIRSEFGPFPLHFDSLLMALISPPLPGHLSPRGSTLQVPEVSIDHLITREQGIYRASAGVLLTPSLILQTLKMAMPKQNVPDLQARGIMQLRKQPQAVLLTIANAPGLRFWAHGDREALSDVLNTRLAFLGSGSALGFGSVAPGTVSVEPSDGDYSWILPDGRPARLLPHTLRLPSSCDSSTWAQRFTRPIPPYWGSEPDQQTLCWMPDPERYWVQTVLRPHPYHPSQSLPIQALAVPDTYRHPDTIPSWQDGSDLWTLGSNAFAEDLDPDLEEEDFY